MACKIKFDNPLLDEQFNYPMPLDKRLEIQRQQINALYEHFTNHQAKAPENLDFDTIYIIQQLASMAEIPGFTSSLPKAGHPSRWNSEDGFKLSAKVQIILLEQPKLSKRNAIIKTGRKLFSDLSEDGVYRRYLDEEKNEKSYISVAKHRIDHLKEITNYDSRTEEQKQYLLNYFKFALNDMYKQLFPDTVDDLFVIKGYEIFPYHPGVQNIKLPDGREGIRIDPQSMFPVS